MHRCGHIMGRILCGYNRARYFERVHFRHVAVRAYTYREPHYKVDKLQQKHIGTDPDITGSGIPGRADLWIGLFADWKKMGEAAEGLVLDTVLLFCVSGWVWGQHFKP